MKIFVAVLAMMAGLFVGIVLSGELNGAPPATQKAAPATTSATTKKKWNIDARPFPVSTRAAVPGKDPLPFVEGSWTLVLIPDVQNYNDVKSPRYPVERSMFSWVVSQKKLRAIRVVVNTGDITNNDAPPEWENARAAYEKFDGRLPYVIVTGNHDYQKGSRSTKLNEHFKIEQNPLNDPAKGGILGGTMDGSLENAWYQLDAGGKKYVIIALEWAPRDKVVAWAKKVAADHEDARVIVVTHAYLYSDSKRYDWAKNGKKQTWNPHGYATSMPDDKSINDGEELWQKLVKDSKNIAMVINGHVINTGLGYLASKATDGRVVHQMLFNRQHEDDGRLRLIEFLPDGRTVQMKTYSPVLDGWATDESNQFIMDWEAKDESSATKPR